MAPYARHQRPHRGLVLFVPLGLCFCWVPAFVGSHTKTVRRRLVSSQATADPAVLEAAKQVRGIQDSGPSGEVQWNVYVKSFADAKDGSHNFIPGSYDAGFLDDFVSNYNDGYRMSSVAAAVAEAAQSEESGVFVEALNDHLRARDVTGITAMSDEVASEFLKLCGELCLKGSGKKSAKKKGKASQASVPSSASEVARKVVDVQNTGPSGAKQWAQYLQSFAESSSPSSSPADYDDDFLVDFVDNFNDGYRLSSASAAAAECAQLESSGTFAKAMEDFLRSNGISANIALASDEFANEFFKKCGQLVSLEYAEDEITPDTPQEVMAHKDYLRQEKLKNRKVTPKVKAPKPPLKAKEAKETFSLPAEEAPLPPPPKETLPSPLPPIEPKKSTQSDTSAKEKVVAPPKSSGKEKVKPPAPDVVKLPPTKAPALAPKTGLEPGAWDAKMRLNEWIHSRLKRKPTLDDMMFGFRLEEAGGSHKYAAELSFLNKKISPSGTVTYSGTPQKTKKDAMDSAAYKALLEFKVEP